MNGIHWACRDIKAGFGKLSLVKGLAISDLQQIYRRSLFGLAWIGFSYSLFVIIKVIIFGIFVPVPQDLFTVWVAMGFWIWLFVIGCIMDGCNVFVHNRAWILGTRLPFSVYALQSVAKVLIRLALSVPFVIIFMYVASWSPTLSWAWAIPGIFVLALNGLWVQFVFGTICARYRDITHLTQALMQVLFFVTPILYTPDALGDYAKFLNYNPFTHFLAIVRDPVVYGSVPTLSWVVVGVITLVGWLLALAVFSRQGRRVAFYI